MSKEQEATMWIDEILNHPDWARVDINWEAIDEIKEMLTKAAPMKPSFSGFNHECAICNDEIHKSNGERYCSNCGQRIDWSDEK